MNTIWYIISELDTYHCPKDSTDIKAKLDSEGRGKIFLREIKALFPNRERISQYGPHKPDGFVTPRDMGKVYFYHDPNFFISIYKKFEKIPRRGESINYLEIIISSADAVSIEEKKKAIDDIIDKYSVDTENKIKKYYDENME